MKEEFPRYRTSIANICECSQNQSQGIELDLQKDKGCVETKGMGAAEMVAGGWLCEKDGVGRGGSAGGVGCSG